MSGALGDIFMGLLGLFLLLLLFGVRFIKENECYAVFSLGQYAGLVGPGFAVRLPFGITRWERFEMGEIGTYIGGGMVEFRNYQLPVFIEGEIRTGDNVEIVGVRGGLTVRSVTLREGQGENPA